MVKLKCSTCNKEFERELKFYNTNLKRGHKIYCSKNCQMQQQKSGKIEHCAFCNREVYVTPKRKDRSKSGLIFCSHSCNASYFNPITRTKQDSGGYRIRAFKEYEHKCAICGWCEDERVLEVHLIDEDRTNNDITNLMILCPICHRYLTLHLYTVEELKKTKYKKVSDLYDIHMSNL